MILLELCSVFPQTGSGVALPLSGTGELLVSLRRERRQVNKTVQDVIVQWHI